MNKLSAFEFEEINRHVDDGWIRRQICSYAPLFIYTYSTNTELEEHWDKYTLMSRGLVLNDKGDIVIRCVPKFFNAGQKFAGAIGQNSQELSQGNIFPCIIDIQPMSAKECQRND